MEHSLDADGRDGGAFQRGKQHTAEAVAERRAISTLERLTDELAVAVVIADFRYLDFRFFDVYHLVGTSSKKSMHKRHDYLEYNSTIACSLTGTSISSRFGKRVTVPER